VVTLAGRRSNFWDLGNALLMLRDTSRYTGDFKRTVKNAGLNLRQAYYLCEIADQLRPFARYKERFEAIGWTKTQVIARGLNKQNLKERLALAEAKGNSTALQRWADWLTGKQAASIVPSRAIVIKPVHDMRTMVIDAVVTELARKHGGSSRMLVEMMLGSTPLDDVNLSNFDATVRDIANQMTRIAA
jgi:hypothetical protein